ncbi:PQQ-like beta-propeller repeat protein [soil metagenome]
MTSALLAALILAAAPAPKDSANSTADWPQWRGPNRDGKSLEKDIVFPKSGPKLLWQSDKIGMGYGQPAVVGNKLFIIGGADNKPGSAESLICMTHEKGEQVWKQPIGTSAGTFNAGWGGGPRSTPTVTDGMVYALGATGDLVCCTADSGKIVWQKNVVKDFGGKIPTWGYSESPLVDDGHVVVTPGNGTGMVALDAKTGKTAWKCEEFKDSAGYSSIIPMMHGKTKLYIQQTMSSALGVNAKTGKLIFKTGEIKRRTAVIPTPVFFEDYIFFTAGYGAGCECYKLSGEGDDIKAEKVYTDYKTIANHHGGVIAIDDKVYGHSDSGGWTCFAFTKANSDPVWQKSSFGKGSITYADGHFFCYQEKDGDLAVIKASTEGWNEVGHVKIPKTSTTRPNQGKVWAHPVIAQGKLFLRDFDLLFVYDLKSK